MMFLENAWYRKSPWLKLLIPVGFVFGKLAARRRRQYQSGKRQAYKSTLPVIVVGNITVGGSGKTPLVIYLAKRLTEEGYKPAIISRGYLSKASSYPCVVTPESEVKEVGDEALMISQNCQCPMIIDPDRASALKKLETEFECNIVISDDGLQHYAMHRDLEIAVIDGSRGLGNNLLLPAGPLRESQHRLSEVDYVVSNGALLENLAVEVDINQMDLKPVALCNLKSGEQKKPHAEVERKKVHAVAGIGNPQRFFNSLNACGFDIIQHSFDDHHAFTKDDLEFNEILNEELDIIMTEKDAVKCRSFAKVNYWYLKVEASLEEHFIDKLLKRLSSIQNLALTEN